MMSDNEYNWNDRQWKMARELLEEFFDRHEFPEELYKETLWSGTDKISVYKTSDETDRFLIEIDFPKQNQANMAYKQATRVFGDFDKLSIFLINKKLFFRKFRY